MKTVKLQIDGMSCASCAKAVEKALGAVPGVENASVNFVSKTAVVDAPDAATIERSLIDAVKRAGYSARPLAKDRDVQEGRRARLQLIKVIGTGALLFLGWLLGATKLVPPAVSTAMVIVAVVLGAYPICRRAIKALLAKRLDADVLVAIAVIAASSVGEYVAAGEVAFIMLLGAQLEEYTIRRARRSLGSLLSLVP
ncbi:MAG: cation transporter, partial [Verrucomicrobiia bacterium]